MGIRMRVLPPRARTLAFPLGLLLATLVVGGCQTSPWRAHDAHRWCRPALRDAPGAPDLTCEALHLCANEVALNPADTERLEDALSRLGCEPP